MSGPMPDQTPPSPAWEQVERAIGRDGWPFLWELIDAARAADASQIAELKEDVLAYIDAARTQRERAEGAESRVAALSTEVERLTQERDAYKRDFDAELAGNAEMRRRLGARDDETMFGFVDRLEAELQQLRQQGAEPK